MTTVLEITSLVTDGKLPAPHSQQIAAALKSLNGKRAVITIKEQKRRRSLNANAYYWGVVLPPITLMFREAGNNVDAEDVHAYLKDHVGKLKQVFVTPDGEVLAGPGSTAKLSVGEFQDYLAKVAAWSAEHGVAIPLLGEES